jgi:NAD-dependent deacetylase
MTKKKVVVLTGAGMSAESGIPTFRGTDGLWEGYKIEEVATPEAWQDDPAKVLRFYNERRQGIKAAKPNEGHKILAGLEADFDVQIITQNIDDLHERAGSTQVLHLHGEIMKSRSEKFEELVYACTDDLKEGDFCERGLQLRPHIVWFGEAVPLLEQAVELCYQADIGMVVGTSLLVYPAASLVDYFPADAPLYVVDPNIPDLADSPKLHKIEAPATVGLQRVKQELYQMLK